MAHKGWISVHRSLLDHHFWGCEKFTKGQAWVDLMLNANHKENKVMIKGRLIVVQRGEQIRSQVTLAETWKWNPRTVKKFLELLISDSMITVKSTELTTHITICNYNEYQNNAEESAEQTTEHSAEGVQSRLQSTVQTNNNTNNANNEKNDNKKPLVKNLDYSCWPSLPDKQIMDDWLVMRKRLKAPVSQTAINRLGKHLHEAVNAGYSMDDCMGEAVTRNWKGFKLEWMQNSAGQNNRSSQKDENAEFRESLNGGDSSAIDGEFHEHK